MVRVVAGGYDVPGARHGRALGPDMEMQHLAGSQAELLDELYRLGDHLVLAQPVEIHDEDVDVERREVERVSCVRSATQLGGHRRAGAESISGAVDHTEAARRRAPGHVRCSERLTREIGLRQGGDIPFDQRVERQQDDPVDVGQQRGKHQHLETGPGPVARGRAEPAEVGAEALGGDRRECAADRAHGDLVQIDSFVAAVEQPDVQRTTGLQNEGLDKHVERPRSALGDPDRDVYGVGRGRRPAGPAARDRSPDLVADISRLRNRGRCRSTARAGDLDIVRAELTPQAVDLFA